MNFFLCLFVRYILVYIVKIIYFVLFFSFTSSLYSQSLKKSNRIDSLMTSKDIEDFILNDSNKINYFLKVEDKINYDLYCDNIADTLNIKKNWWKSDFDNNGLTDLLVIGNTSDGPKTICILDQGNGFKSKSISKGELYEKCSFSKVKDNSIEYQSVKVLDRYGNLSKLIKENLVYKFGDFIEENPNPKRHHILKIEFQEGGSHWDRSTIKIEIISNRDIAWTINDYESSKVYNSRLSKESFKEIVDLLNYIDFENLNDEYSVAYSDAGTTTLKITYDNLKIKNINDYGGMGTRGLRKLYDTFLKLREP